MKTVTKHSVEIVLNIAPQILKYEELLVVADKEAERIARQNAENLGEVISITATNPRIQMVRTDDGYQDPLIYAPDEVNALGYRFEVEIGVEE